MVNIVRSGSANHTATPAAHVGSSSDSTTSASGGDRRRDLAVHGRAIDYADREFDISQAWGLLSPKMQAWATDRAGEPIADPVTGKRRCYKFVDVSRTGENWAEGGSPAEYSLLMFGKRGLVVAYGMTDELVPQPGGTRWRTSRWDLPIDPGGVRHDHLSEVPGNTNGSAAGDLGTAGEGASGWLDPGTAANLGNLPVQTQSFLLDPFVRSEARPQDGGVQALRTLAGRHLTEELWSYFFNGRWVAFSYARRTAARPPRRTGADELAGIPWDVAAWIAPVVKAGRPELTP